MEGINIRFKELRLKCEKNQEEWGTIFGLTKSGVSDIERGKRNVTDRHLIMLKNWKEHAINIEWLKTGEGDPFTPLTRNQIITDFAGDLIKEDDTFKKRLIEALAELNESEWEMLERLAVKLATKKDQE